ncbi:unnamed protein product [Lathyrus sativus]|nr:unnamed protein product [Lathyrus sativus]
MGFGTKWMKWIRGSIFNSFVSILINGSPSKDFRVGRGLKQGDPLAPFLFAIAAEGLSSLVKSAVAGNMLSQFMIHGQPTVSILQFADDTLLIVDGSTSNIWAFKAILRAFELISGLKTNYFKSCLYGIHIEPDFLVAAEDFLHCKSGKLPFSFLGITAPQKEDGGLAIKHVGRFNSSLLAKWLWRFQTGGNEIWRNTLTIRYGNLSIKTQTFSDVDSSKSDSLWMKDIMNNASLNSHTNFCKFTACSVGEGNDAAFWQSVWIDDMPLKVRFNGLFQCCSLKSVSVRDMGYWEDGKWNWNLRNSLLDSDNPPEPDWSDCCKLLENISVIPGESDKRRWSLHESLIFKVSSFYSVLYSSLSEQDIGSDCASHIKSIWKTVIPAKVQTLSWRLALDRLPTRSNLLKRRVLNSEQDLDCVVCSSSLEDVSHIFFSCYKSTQVWNKICEWADIDIISENCCYSHAKVWNTSLSGRCQANRVNSIWFITCWNIWRSRNDCIFNNVVTEVDSIVFDIKLNS